MEELDNIKWKIEWQTQKNKQVRQARKRQSNKGWHTKENLKHVSRIRWTKQKSTKTQSKLNQKHMQIEIEESSSHVWTVRVLYFAETIMLSESIKIVPFYVRCFVFFFHSIFSCTDFFLFFFSALKNLKNSSQQYQFSTTKSMNKCIW